jgi:hypothetical protein
MIFKEERMKWILMTVLLMCGVAHAQEVAEAAQVVQPDIPWLKDVLAFLQSIPVVGPYVKIGVEVMASIAVFMTALAAFLKSVLTISYVAAMKFAPSLALSIIKFEERVLPWIKYMSMMNADKKELEKAHVPKLML